jgi:hypothetical protein
MLGARCWVPVLGAGASCWVPVLVLRAGCDGFASVVWQGTYDAPAPCTRHSAPCTRHSALALSTRTKHPALSTKHLA